MTCLEFLENVHAYALGALEPDEAASCEAHLAAPEPHQGCIVAYQRAVAAVGRLASTVPPVRPSQKVWQQIEAQIEKPRLLRRASREVVAWGLAVAAASAFLIARFQQASEQRERAQLQNQLTAAKAELTAAEQCRKELEAIRQSSGHQLEALALLDRPGTRVVPLAGQGGRAVRASAVFNPGEGRAILVTTALQPQPNKDYQLWIIRGKEAPIPAGLAQVAPSGIVIAEFDRAKLGGGAPDAFAVSIEPKGGSQKPTDVLLIGSAKG